MAAPYHHRYESDRDRVEKCVDVRSDGCWFWKLSTFKSGYGMVRVNKRNLLAHRFCWEAIVGPIPDGAVLCHRCDRKLCCNPQHLYVGTTQTNADDAIRARSLLGSRHPRARFTEAQVRAVRKEHARGGVTYLQLAERYGVSSGTIGALVRGQNWRHVGGALAPGTARFRGAGAPLAKLTEKAVRAIRESFERGERQVDLARKHDVTMATIGAVVRRKSWKHVA